MNIKVGDLFEVVTGSAGALDVHASFVDINTSTGAVSPDRTNTAQIATATTTTIIAAPAASNVRKVKFIALTNSSATSANKVTPKHSDGTTHSPITSYILQPGDALHYNEISGWAYIPSTNSVQVPGRLLATTFLTSASANFTTGHFTNTLRIYGVGGGGGGGGCTSVVSAAGAAGGGGAGGYCEKTAAVSPDTAYAYTCGVAGASNSGAGGGNGGDSTFVINGVTYTVKGGTGAVVSTSNAALTAWAGGAGGIVGSNGDINASGMPGEPGIVLVVATPVVSSGNGGTGPFGAGGLGIVASAAGNAGTGNGSGGGGAATGASTVRAGGAGTAGAWLVEEYA